jgi:hypothetical protein
VYRYVYVFLHLHVSFWLHSSTATAESAAGCKQQLSATAAKQEEMLDSGTAAAAAAAAGGDAGSRPASPPMLGPDAEAWQNQLMQAVRDSERRVTQAQAQAHAEQSGLSHQLEDLMHALQAQSQAFRVCVTWKTG